MTKKLNAVETNYNNNEEQLKLTLEKLKLI